MGEGGEGPPRTIGHLLSAANIHYSQQLQMGMLDFKSYKKNLKLNCEDEGELSRQGPIFILTVSEFKGPKKSSQRSINSWSIDADVF